MPTSKSILQDKSFTLALGVIRIYKFLFETKREYVMSKQLLRSGTAVGALVREARNGESRKDFIHKLGIAQKECDETLYWLELLEASEYLDQAQKKTVYEETEQVLKMIKSSIITTRNNSV